MVCVFYPTTYAPLNPPNNGCVVWAGLVALKSINDVLIMTFKSRKVIRRRMLRFDAVPSRGEMLHTPAYMAVLHGQLECTVGSASFTSLNTDRPTAQQSGHAKDNPQGIPPRDVQAPLRYFLRQQTCTKGAACQVTRCLAVLGSGNSGTWEW